ncbi:translation elongation factor 2 (EF-2/EF-G) [Formivibrio citricus]|uniref:Elongation factor G n=1 Tax=Formivibrio citricus TaxID=83765 RepID=A0A1I5A400_9NEIS|nr:elongation factor G [Formivibrio citricus]SFN57128.1 translation elongation factor 2 (EF-2/EF-G) [Formivibrio citricus]
MPAVQNIRTLAFLGHAGAGKTTLVESLLALSGAINQAGSVEKGTTVCDYDPLEKEHQHTAKLAAAYLDHGDVRIHLLDTPGFPDFAGQAMAALDAVETVAAVINPQNDIEISARRAMLWAQTRKLCRVVVVNRIDCERLELEQLLSDLQSAFGRECLPLNLPAAGGTKVVDCFFNLDGEATDFGSVEAAHNAIVEQIVEVDEALTERYLNGEEVAPEELHDAFEQALREGHLLPVLFTSARTGAGLPQLLDFIARLAPNPLEGNPPLFEKWPGGDAEAAEPFNASHDPAEHVIAHVFKVEVDPYMGKIGTVRVLQGTLTPDSLLYAGEARKPFRVAHLYSVQGKTLTAIQSAGPGEICAITKIDDIHFDAVLHDAPEDSVLHFHPLPLPHAVYGLALRVKRRGEEQKLSEVLHRMALEDPGLEVESDPTTREIVIRGLGELHLGRVLERMRAQYKLEVDSHPPSIPYRETITAPAEGHHRHKKQSGGAGQFGEVYLRIAPLARGEGFRFKDAVKGGTIPGVFIPAVEKGVREALASGAIAGFPIQDVEVTVYDGKTHAVDGKEVAFVTAGRKAFVEAMLSASPVVLEPYVNLEITVPDFAMGDVSGELSSRRGQVTNTGGGRAGMLSISARAPLAELSDFQTRLKSLTGGQGSYTLELAEYEEVPPQVQTQLSAAFRPHVDEQ